MPQYQPITISYSQGGLDESKAAFNLSDDSFQQLFNAYNFRGRIRRRQGYQLLGRLARNFTSRTLQNDNVTPMSYTPPGAGSQSISIFTIFGINVLEPNASLQPGNTTIPLVFTLDPLGANETIFTDTLGDGSLTITGGGPIASSATINYNTGVITAVFTAAPGALTVSFTLSYYPLLPVMGLHIFETTVLNNENLIAFDTRYSYTYSALNNQFLQLGSPTTWQGDDSNFFYATNVLVPGSTNFLFFATNFNVGLTPDPIRYFDGTMWNNFAPFIDTPNTIRLQQARIIVQYRGRVVFLYTHEGATLAGSAVYSQRARWSQFGSVLDPNAFLDDVGGRGGFIDCPTSEQIVSADFIRDTLVVGFERSTWKLRYTGNEITPFVWERINKELGVESTFSTVSFDKGVLGVGDKSINVCDGNGVEAIDENIPDEVFQIHNGSDGPMRVHGIRDFYLRQVYWTFPDAEQNAKFPNRMFVFDYERGSWAIFTDSFTTLGTYQQSADIRWIDLPIPWSSANFAWNESPLQSGFPHIIGGNQQGYVEILNQQVQNDVSLYISAITGGASPLVITSIDHNMQSGEFIQLDGILGDFSSLNGTIYQINVLTDDTFQIATRETNGNFTDVILPVGSYNGRGQIIRIFNMLIQSKKFNLAQQGSAGLFGYIDFLMRSTENGEISCEIRTDYDDSIPINAEDPLNTNNFYNNSVTTQPNSRFNATGNEIWQRFYCPTRAQFFDFTLTFNDRQMVDPLINGSDVYIDSIIVWASKDGRLVQ